MRKYLLILLFISSLSIVSANTTIGVMGATDDSKLTFSMDKVEFELGITSLANLSILVGADYSLAGTDFAIANTSGFFWDLGIGAETYLSINSFSVGVIVPVEFGYTVPILNGMDIYIQVKPGVNIFPNVNGVVAVGLGVRLGL